ncbi:hypothetical protein Taro_031082, partial [Colocasia esculenta]|nr:hypothetical protein [Colocasia esculenta]
MASRGRRGGVPAREDEPRHDERVEQQTPAPEGPVLPPPPPVDYGVFMQGLVQAMQTQAPTQAALQAQLEAQEHYALVDCRRKRIVFRIHGEDEFSHPLPRNLAGKLVISAMKAMHMRPTPACGPLHPALCLRDMTPPFTPRLYPAASPLHHVLTSHSHQGLASAALASRRPRERPGPPSLHETLSALAIVNAPTPQAALRS